MSRLWWAWVSHLDQIIWQTQWCEGVSGEKKMQCWVHGNPFRKVAPQDLGVVAQGHAIAHADTFQKKSPWHATEPNGDGRLDSSIAMSLHPDPRVTSQFCLCCWFKKPDGPRNVREKWWIGNWAQVRPEGTSELHEQGAQPSMSPAWLYQRPAQLPSRVWCRVLQRQLTEEEKAQASRLRLWMETETGQQHYSLIQAGSWQRGQIFLKGRQCTPSSTFWGRKLAQDGNILRFLITGRRPNQLVRAWKQTTMGNKKVQGKSMWMDGWVGMDTEYVHFPHQYHQKHPPWTPNN